MLVPRCRLIFASIPARSGNGAKTSRNLHENIEVSSQRFPSFYDNHELPSMRHLDDRAGGGRGTRVSKMRGVRTRLLCAGAENRWGVE
jgi:hypothetical protein